MTAPRISVVLPVFNGERYLRESLDSLMAQTYESFEVVIWDDGSKDRSAAIVAEYRDPRVRSFANAQNTGLFATLNLAIAEARGDLIRLWAQDDRMKPQCLEVEAAFWTAHP